MTTQSLPVDTTYASRRAKQFIPPPIPFERPPRQELKKDQQLTVTLRSNPTDPHSQTYNMTIPFFRHGTPEEWLLIKKTLMKILVGQNITAGPPKYAMARRVLEGDALARFDAKASELASETNANFDLCINAVTSYVFPTKALQYQRRFMRRHLRKNRDSTIREFNSRLLELNAYLSEFPPYGTNQTLVDDDLMEVLEFAIPNTWQSTMVVQGFTPSEHSTSELVDFCERLEFIENLTPTNGNKGKSSQPDPKGSNKKDHKRGGKSFEKASGHNQPNKRQKTKGYCPLHDTDTHDMSECKVMQNQAKKMREAYANRGQFKKSGSTSRDNDKNKELNAFINKAVQKAIRKADTDKASEEELDAFNACGDFRSLKIDSGFESDEQSA